MKYPITLVLIYFLTLISLSAQESNDMLKEEKIGITFSTFGENSVVRFAQVEGAGSVNGDYFFNFGINYIRSLNNFLDFETGLEYSQHSLYVYPAYDPWMSYIDYYVDPSQVQLLNIPISLRLNFFKYFFVNAGLLVDIDLDSKGKIDNQNGLGGILGLAVNYNFDVGVSMFINPYIKVHTIVPVFSETYHQRLLESGLRFGITYDM